MGGGSSILAVSIRQIRLLLPLVPSPYTDLGTVVELRREGRLVVTWDASGCRCNSREKKGPETCFLDLRFWIWLEMETEIGLGSVRVEVSNLVLREPGWS